VYHALRNNSIKNYWNNTGRFDEIIKIIKFDITGIKDEIIELIKGNEISIELRKFDTNELQKEYKGDDRGKNNDTIRRS